MKKRNLLLLFALIFSLSLFSSVALTPDPEQDLCNPLDLQGSDTSPMGALLLSCGLRNVSGSTYELWASSTTSTTDNIFLSVTLERNENGYWNTYAYTTVTVVGTYAYASKNVTIVPGYQYRVSAYTKGNNSSTSTTPKYYSF